MARTPRRASAASSCSRGTRCSPSSRVPRGSRHPGSRRARTRSRGPAPSTPPQRPRTMLGHRLHLGDVGDVHLEHLGHRAQPLRALPGQAHRPPERGEHHLGACRLRSGGDREGDAPRGQHTGDDDSLAAEEVARGVDGFSVLTGDVPYKARTGIRSYAATISSIASCHAGVPARMSPLTKTASGSPPQSVTTPPASRTSSAPAAMSQRPRPSSK